MPIWYQRAPSLSMDVLAKWCSVLEYPLDDFIAKRPYSEPGSLTDLSRKLDKVIKKIEALEKEVTELKKTNPSIFHVKVPYPVYSEIIRYPDIVDFDRIYVNPHGLEGIWITGIPI